MKSLSAIITNLRYVKSVSSKLGSHLRKEPNEIFVSFDGCGPRCWVGDRALVGTPVIDLPTFPPHPKSNHPRPAGSLKFIAWPHTQRALVLATDPNFIADVRLGFVDLTDIAEMEEPK